MYLKESTKSLSLKSSAVLHTRITPSLELYTILGTFLFFFYYLDFIYIYNLNNKSPYIYIWNNYYNLNNKIPYIYIYGII